MLHDPAKAIPFQPREGGPTYRLRVPRVIDRASYQRAILGAGGQFWPNLELVRLCRDELAQVLAGEAQAEALASGLGLLDAYAGRLEAAITAWRQERNPATEAEFEAALPFPPAMAELMNELARCSPRVARAAAGNAVYPLLRGIEAARLFLMGWDRAEPFRRDVDGATEATLALIPDGDFIALGQHVDGLLEPGEARLGNSASPSSGSPVASASSPAGTATPPSDPSAATTAGA